jgi:hypothetical protein
MDFGGDDLFPSLNRPPNLSVMDNMDFNSESARASDRQPFPTDPVLSQNLDRELPGLDPEKRSPPGWDEGEPDLSQVEHADLYNSFPKSALASPVIAYVLTTLEWDSQSRCLKQKGSAPNFQGGLVRDCGVRG